MITEWNEFEHMETERLESWMKDTLAIAMGKRRQAAQMIGRAKEMKAELARRAAAEKEGGA